MFETGANRWRSFDAWPPKGLRQASLYLHADGRLAFDPPSGEAAAFDEYVSDPAKPVPYIGRVMRDRGEDYMIADQRFAATRPDVLVYRTEPLTESLTVAGPIPATVFVSTTGTDADWVVKLIDVYPDDTASSGGVAVGGYQQLVRAEIMRGKFRNSYERPEPFVPNRPTRVELTLPDVLHTFLKGHRVMVQVQSSWFPLVDRNPQRFVDIYRAQESDFRKATHRVYRSARLPSKIGLAVLP